MRKKWLYWFWGVMDFFYICLFGYLNFSQGKVPFYSDIQSYLVLGEEHGLASGFMFLLSIFLNVSIVITMVLFFTGSRKIPGLVYVQMPLRLLLAVPSLSFFMWALKVGGATSVIWLLFLLLFSEVVKLLSIVYRSKFSV
jgi:hypothetical protein